MDIAYVEDAREDHLSSLATRIKSPAGSQVFLHPAHSGQSSARP